MSILPPASEEVRTTVHDLEVKRGSRRGIATKLHNRIKKVIAEGPDRIKASTLEDLFAQLTVAIDNHTAFQAQLEEFYETFVVRQLTAIPVVERHYSHSMLPPEYSAG